MIRRKRRPRHRGRDGQRFWNRCFQRSCVGNSTLAGQHRHVDVGVVHAHFALAFRDARHTARRCLARKRAWSGRVAAKPSPTSTRGKHHLRPLRSADPRGADDNAFGLIPPRSETTSSPASERPASVSRCSTRSVSTSGERAAAAQSATSLQNVGDQLAAEAVKLRAGIGLRRRSVETPWAAPGAKTVEPIHGDGSDHRQMIDGGLLRTIVAVKPSAFPRPFETAGRVGDHETVVGHAVALPMRRPPRR